VEALEARLGEKLSRVFDYAEYGGAPLLGVAGLAIVGHGRSSAKAVSSGIVMAHRFATLDFIQRVEQEIAAAGVSHH
jgi:glycerol-3-phosphate acyltransferase PlsX